MKDIETYEAYVAKELKLVLACIEKVSDQLIYLSEKRKVKINMSDIFEAEVRIKLLKDHNSNYLINQS